MSDINKCLAACVEYRAKLDKLEAENAKLRNELARLNGQTMWVCTCGGTDCAGLKENAELRADKERLDWLEDAPIERLVRITHLLITNDLDICKVSAAIDAARKEAQP